MACSIHSRSGRRKTFPGATFCANSYFGIGSAPLVSSLVSIPPLLLIFWYLFHPSCYCSSTEDPCHSAKSVHGRLQPNLYTPSHCELKPTKNKELKYNRIWAIQKSRDKHLEQGTLNGDEGGLSSKWSLVIMMSSFDLLSGLSSSWSIIIKVVSSFEWCLSRFQLCMLLYTHQCLGNLFVFLLPML